MPMNSFTNFSNFLFVQVTNDIFTKEDGEFLVKHGALPEERIRAVETGGCPHAAIREDISINLGPLEELSNLYKTDILLCESGGGELLVLSYLGFHSSVMDQLNAFIWLAGLVGNGLETLMCLCRMRIKYHFL